MKKIGKATGRATSIPTGIALGTLASIVITLLGCAVIAFLVSNQTIGEGSVGYGSIILLLVAAASGSFISVKMVKRLRLQICLLTGAAYYLMLLSLTALLFGGRYQGMGVTALVILGAVGIVAFLPTKKETNWKATKRAYR